MAQRVNVRSHHVNLLMDLRMSFMEHAYADGVLTLAELRIKAAILEALIGAQRIEAYETIGRNISDNGEMRTNAERLIRETERDLMVVQAEFDQINAEIARLEQSETPVIDIATYRATREPQSIA